MSDRATTSGRPPAPGWEDGSAPEPMDPATGQHTSYWILSDEERAKGFLRPMRRVYRHTVCGTSTSMSWQIAETYARDPTFYSATFCAQCRTHLPVAEFRWIEADGSAGPVVGT